MSDKDFTRDNKKHKELKDSLIQEAVLLYGSAKCFASHKAYKGMIASHIKPFKICILEDDFYNAYNKNNALLLASNIDAYFDKFDITFGENGKIICSENIPEEIQKEFSSYYLDEALLNTERKKNLEIHRSLYYYKNYIQAHTEFPDPVKAFDLPIINCNLKTFQGNVICKSDGYWMICPPSKAKQMFIQNTGCQLKSYISNADFLGKLLEEPAYRLKQIPEGFNTPDGKWTSTKGYVFGEQNSFKISCTDVNPEQGDPVNFKRFLYQAFNGDNELVQLFRSILKVVIEGNGFKYSVFLTGNLKTINSLLLVLKELFGSYLFEYTNIKDVYSGNTTDNIPNCRMLVIKTRKTLPESKVITEIQQNDFFLGNSLNIDKYTAFYIVEDKQYLIDNAIIFRFCNAEDNGALVSEAGKILNWILNTQINSQIFDTAKNTVPKPIASAVGSWLSECCITTFNKKDLTSAEELYTNYKEYAHNHGFVEISKKAFGNELSGRPILKIRRGSGIYYGIKLLRDAN